MSADLLGPTELLDARLSGELVRFSQHLRLNSFNVGLQESMDMHRVALAVNITNKRLLRMALKPLLCTTPDQRLRFDEVFDAYWRVKKHSHGVRRVMGQNPAKRSPLAPRQEGSAKGELDVAAPLGDASLETDPGEAAHQGASSRESLAKANFNQLTSQAELREMEDQAERIARSIRKCVIRRRRHAAIGRSVDVRKTLRRSLRFGGLPLELSYRLPQKRLPKLIVLVDVSRSMSVYSYLFLRFVRGLLGAFSGSDAFAFHTQLVHIGGLLREPNRLRMIEKMILISTGWNGGTQIGQSLDAFNRQHASGVLDSRSIFVIVSDGYDTGEPDVLVSQLARIQRRAKRVVWLNPLLGLEGYTPSTRCMKAALPYIDLFAPAHSLESLAALEAPLSRL